MKNDRNFLIVVVLFLVVPIFLIGSMFVTELLINKKQVTPPSNKISEMLQLGYGNLTTDEADFYAMMFSKYSKKYNIDWRIYPAIIVVESNWDPSAISDSGAKGTMQVMDSTFKIECFRYKITYIEKKTIQNDVILLGRGLEYLSRMVKDKGTERGVKSYIGGPGYRETNKECIAYYVKFQAEYAKVIALSKEYQRMEDLIVARSLNN